VAIPPAKYSSSVDVVTKLFDSHQLPPGYSFNSLSVPTPLRTLNRDMSGQNPTLEELDDPSIYMFRVFGQPTVSITPPNDSPSTTMTRETRDKSKRMLDLESLEEDPSGYIFRVMGQPIVSITSLSNSPSTATPEIRDKREWGLDLRSLEGPANLYSTV
jgi:hypothetical protein